MRVCVCICMFVVECVQCSVGNMWICECGEGGMRGRAGGLSVMHYANHEFMVCSEEPLSGLCISKELSINVQFIQHQVCLFIILSAVFHDWVL